MSFFFWPLPCLRSRGTFNLPIVLFVAIVANCSADQIYYSIARARGLTWLEARFGRHKQYSQIVGWMRRHSNWLLRFRQWGAPAATSEALFPTPLRDFSAVERLFFFVSGIQRSGTELRDRGASHPIWEQADVARGYTGLARIEVSRSPD